MKTGMHAFVRAGLPGAHHSAGHKVIPTIIPCLPPLSLGLQTFTHLSSIWLHVLILFSLKKPFLTPRDRLVTPLGPYPHRMLYVQHHDSMFHTVSSCFHCPSSSLDCELVRV